MHTQTTQQPATALPRYADWLTTDAVAAQCGTSVAVVNAWIVTGVKSERGVIRLRASKIGGRWRIEPSAVTAFIDATTAASLPASATASAAQPPEPVRESAAARRIRLAQCMDDLAAMGVTGDPKPRTRRS